VRGLVSVQWAPRYRRACRGHRAHQHQPTSAGTLAGLDYMAGAISIGSEKVGLIPRGHHAGHVEDHVLPLDGALQSDVIMEIAGHHAPSTS